MVQYMTNVYKALTPEEQEYVYIQAVGKDIYSSSDTNFCKGSFGMCHDEAGEPWWNSWNALQRDVLFFYRYNDDDWNFYCQYSMNTYSSEVGNTIKGLLYDIQENSNVTMTEIKTEISDHKTSPSQETVEENDMLNVMEEDTNVTVTEIKTEILDQSSSSQQTMEENDILDDGQEDVNVTAEKTETSETLDQKKPPLQEETTTANNFDLFDIIEEMKQNTIREDVNSDPSTITASATEFTSSSNRIKALDFVSLSLWTLALFMF